MTSVERFFCTLSVVIMAVSAVYGIALILGLGYEVPFWGLVAASGLMAALATACTGHEDNIP